MSIEVGRASKIGQSPEKLGALKAPGSIEDFLDSLKYGTKPSGRDFVDIVCEDPTALDGILDAICAATGDAPVDATDVARLFEFNSVEEVEYFFANLT